MQKGKDEPRTNREVDAPRVRLIGPDGEMLGVMTGRDALREAQKFGLDLVEIQPKAVPPVCKILDYGKYKYEMQKKASETRRKQKIVLIKEIKLRPTIGDHDMEIKMRALHKFLEEGDKVKVTLRFRGREMAHLDLCMALFKRVKEYIGDKGKIESEPRMEGRQAVMMVGPAKTS